MTMTGDTDPEVYLGGALDAGRWVAAQAADSGQGLVWSTQHGSSSRFDRSYYEGSSGIGLFLLQLLAATGDDRWLEAARRVGDDLVATYSPTSEVMPTILWPEPYGAGRWSFYTGHLGRAFFLSKLAEATGDASASECAQRICDDAVAAGRHEDGSLAWSGEPGLLDDGGIALALRQVGEATGRQDLVQAAALAAGGLLRRARPTDAGLRWDSVDGARLGAPGAHWPGLEFGTSGVAYACASLSDLDATGALLSAAEQGAAHIRSLGAPQGDGFAVPYRQPDHEDLFYVGTCNGSSGVARMFYRLWQVTGDPTWLDQCRGLFRGLESLGAPEEHSPGYWRTSSLCCGTAALLHFACGMWWGTGSDDYLLFARRAAERLLGEAVASPEGLSWPDCFSRLDPADVVARTSYSIGAAGAGAALLHLHLALTGDRPVLRTIDDPFPVAAPAERHWPAPDTTATEDRHAGAAS